MQEDRLKQEVLKELAMRELESQNKDKQDSLIEFMEYFFEKEKKTKFETCWFHYVIEDYLKQVLDGKITRLIINMPPRHSKTEVITKCFPVWALGKYPTKEIISTGYSTSLTQEFSSQARDYYQSDAYKSVFPRSQGLRDDQNTKEYWKLKEGGSYYATGTGGTITGRGANIFIIDDAIRPDEANKSDIIREGINSWFSNTVVSRLNNPAKDAVIIVMQRTHENDLCGFLQQRMKDGIGEEWTVLSLPAIAEKDEMFNIDGKIYGRKEGEPLDAVRFPVKSLEMLKKSYGLENFECQYQQNPNSNLTREFHNEWFQYYTEIPSGGRTFMAVDPAFTKKKYSDYSCIMTIKVIDDRIYILDYIADKFDPSELIHAMVTQYKKWNPEKVGIEAVQAQTIIIPTFKNTLNKQGIYPFVEDIRNTDDKEGRIRGLIPHFRDMRMYIRTGIEQKDSLENQLLKFPRGAHDDIPDALAMGIKMIELQPNLNFDGMKIRVEYDKNGRPKIIA